MISYKKYNTPNTSGTSNTKEYIVLHHTGTGRNSINWVINWFTTWPVSAHYVVDTNGDIYKMNTDDDILRHAGMSERDGKSWMNLYSIWIEIIWPLPGFTDAQRKSVRMLCLELMKAHIIPHTHIIRHKDISPGRKVDVDDAFWTGQYWSYSAYQQSYADFWSIMWLYEKRFKQEFWDIIAEGATILSDIPWALWEIVTPTWSFNLKEFLYLHHIWLERTRKEFLPYIYAIMGRYEEIYKQEFADLIAQNKTVISDIDGAVKRLINNDGTLNLKELIYFMNIWFERIRREIQKK